MTASAKAAPAPSRVARFLRAVSRSSIPISRPLAARGLIGIWGVLEHTGRTSGRRYRIPVAIIRSNGGFIVPLPWGAATQWSRNVLASGRCTITWHSREYATIDPVVADWATVRPSFNRVLQALVPILGIAEFVVLTEAI